MANFMTSRKSLIEELRSVVSRGRNKGFGSSKAFYKAFEDAIDVVEKGMIVLPCDVDGRVITLGSIVECMNFKGEVVGVGGDLVFIKSEDDGEITPAHCSLCHVLQSVTTEGLLNEFAKELNKLGAIDADAYNFLVGKYSKEIQSLLCSK